MSEDIERPARYLEIASAEYSTAVQNHLAAQAHLMLSTENANRAETELDEASRRIITAALKRAGEVEQ